MLTGTLASNSTSVSPSVCLSISAGLPATVSTSALHLRWPDCLQVSRPSLLLACYPVCKKGLSVYLGQCLASVWTFTSASISTCVTTNSSASTLGNVLPSVLFSSLLADGLTCASALHIDHCVSGICNSTSFTFSPCVSANTSPPPLRVCHQVFQTSLVPVLDCFYQPVGLPLAPSVDKFFDNHHF